MKNISLILLIMFYCVSLHATDITITGMVINSKGDPVKGADVRLQHHKLIKSKTDKDGQYNLTGDIITGVSGSAESVSFKMDICVKNNKLTFYVSEIVKKGMVTIYNSRGVVIYKSVFNSLTKGYHERMLKTGYFAQGLYLIHMKFDKKQYSLKMLKTGEKSFSGMSTVTGSDNFTTISSMGYVFTDTLLVSANGYKHLVNKNVEFSSDAIEMSVCTLMTSNPWIPDTDLEYNGGMVKIYAKDYNFEMGQPDPDANDKDMSIDEQPVHTVSFTYDFWMDTTENTQKEYETVMKVAYDNYFTPEWKPNFGVGDNKPTYAVSWEDAALYCNAISVNAGLDTIYIYDSINGKPGCLCEFYNLKIDMSKNGYRLPTESEWEYACRAGSATSFYWNKDYAPYPETSDDTIEISNNSIWLANSWNLITSDDWGTNVVAKKLPNAYGLYDMSGNLYEWCNDIWGIYPWKDQIDPTGVKTGEYRTLRGGSWGNTANYLRSANRQFFNPDYKYYFIGFRVVLPVW